ncbi:MAG: hypothetical protein V1676_00910 [Candidatus Diapherotrites archaeon]
MFGKMHIMNPPVKKLPKKLFVVDVGTDPADYMGHFFDKLFGKIRAGHILEPKGALTIKSEDLDCLKGVEAAARTAGLAVKIPPRAASKAELAQWGGMENFPLTKEMAKHKQIYILEISAEKVKPGHTVHVEKWYR